MEEPRYWSPYAAGVGIGLTLVATYYVMGHGLGASGAFAQAAARLVGEIAPEHARDNPYFRSYLADRFWTSWIIVEVLGIFVGGWIGAVTAKRWRVECAGCAAVGAGRRVGLALCGGLITGFGSRLALGCTSGQALSGGAALALGSWVFTLMFFAGGYLLAAFVRRQWR